MRRRHSVPLVAVLCLLIVAKKIIITAITMQLF